MCSLDERCFQVRGPLVFGVENFSMFYFLYVVSEVGSSASVAPTSVAPQRPRKRQRGRHKSMRKYYKIQPHVHHYIRDKKYTVLGGTSPTTI